jgi:hypothetical protein
MESQRDGEGLRSNEPNRSREYEIRIEILRPDWVADWYGDQVRIYSRLSGVPLSELSEAGALQVLREIAEAMNRREYGVEWPEDEEGRAFVMNGKGVCVRVHQSPPSEWSV